NLSSPKLPQPIFLPTLKFGPTNSSRELEEEEVLDPGCMVVVAVLLAVLALDTLLEAGSWSSLPPPPPPPRSLLSPFCMSAHQQQQQLPADTRLTTIYLCVCQAAPTTTLTSSLLHLISSIYAPFSTLSAHHDAHTALGDTPILFTRGLSGLI
ncbi:hypothetical protein OTU49_010580, partial [Cherax quadricarinatus]